MQARIYEVTDNHAKKHLMVKATSQSQALRHVAKRQFVVTVPSALAVADYLTSAGTIVDATTETQTTTEKE